MAGSFLTGVMSGNHRFISAIAERVYHVETETVGAALGVSLGLSGIVAATIGAHAIDRAVRKADSSRMLLWCAVLGDFFHLIFGTAALFMPTFELMVLGLALSACASAMSQGVDTSIQLLAVGRRATTQAFLELNWSVGMATGPFLGGYLSASFYSISCDSGCALSQSLLIVGGMGLALRMFFYMLSSAHLPEDVASVNAELNESGSASPGTLKQQYHREKDVEECEVESPSGDTTIYGRSNMA